MRWAILAANLECFAGVGCGKNPEAGDATPERGPAGPNVDSNSPPPAAPSPDATPIPTPTPNPSSPVRTLTVGLPGDVTLELVYIPAGKFMMGSPEAEVGRQKAITPAALAAL